MPVINQTTFIAAPVDRVFDLSRNVSLLKQPFLSENIHISGEKISGLMSEGESMTLQFKLLFKQRTWTLKIVKFIKPDIFVQEQVEGFLKSFKHEYFFKPCENGCFLIEQLTYELRNGVTDVIADKFVYRNFLMKLLEIKNSNLKQVAESGRWKQYTNG